MFVDIQYIPHKKEPVYHEIKQAPFCIRILVFSVLSSFRRQGEIAIKAV